MSEKPTRYDTAAGQQELRRRGVRPLPAPDDLTRPYWEAARRHQLVVQRCAPCGAWQHPPAPSCRACGAGELAWQPLSGRGTIYSFIVDHRLLIPSFDEPYVVAQVNPVEAPDDAVRITANIRGCDPAEVHIGMPVEVLFEDVDERLALPQFRPAAGATSAGRGQGRPREGA